MNSRKYNWILYLISLTIVITIAVQLYWNYKNYIQNKQYVINEIQQCLDSAIEEYVAEQSKEEFLTMKESNDSYIEKKSDSILLESLSKKIKQNFGFKKTFSIDSKIKTRTPKIFIFSNEKNDANLDLLKKVKTIFKTLKNDTLNLSKIDSILTNSLINKKIISSFYLHHTKNDSLIYNSKKSRQPTYQLSANAKTTYLPLNEKISLFYSGTTKEILRRGFIGILLSFILSFAIIASLFYLLKIINKQKELAEIKNDLISNITHEFKTPITTISTVIEAMQSFNALNDIEKTKKYLSISSIQLKKLHQMVEKFLETAALDSEKLILKKETSDIVEMIKKNTVKYQLVNSCKKINFSSVINKFPMRIDIFHFENAISNLIDNAIKYGGDSIEVSINKTINEIEIFISDNGSGIEKNQHEKIFDKFHRVPRGNTHDVKGFGIGLYYTRKIIEKHGGFIKLLPSQKKTIFKINIPYD